MSTLGLSAFGLSAFGLSALGLSTFGLSALGLSVEPAVELPLQAAAETAIAKAKNAILNEFFMFSFCDYV
ncbi:hypothetical protein E2R66_05460 [Mucilaginibacter psychrotolerans]|uniref:Uncharacterized protein n=1 Tax=Mucilaginibacter psychrotolerans TaxID=1524096 RepID=A0A4Y8SN96_9SPHI|nr:hypothetical protein E2R66_05460 [Mucilaginibacter psychrotolerans]